jgi:RNA-directed DNA polymerase
MTFSIDDLAEHAGTSTAILEWLSSALPTGEGRLYNRWPSRKKHGGMREIFEPLSPFDAISKNLHRSFTSLLPYESPGHVHGFVRGRSAFSNASQHLGKKCVLRVDLEDFFPSITAAMVKASLLANGYEEKAAELAVKVVTIASKLPIGLSTSPLLSNMVFLSTDRSLAEYAQSEGLSFTRYVDDLTFSGEITDRHRADICRILDDDNWSINTRKTVFMRRGGPQYVTGLYVGEPDRPRIPPKTKRRMRWTLHMISKFGYDIYMDEFHGEEKGMHRRRLLGWACYIDAVEPDLGHTLLRAFHELIPEERGGTPEWGDANRDRITRVTYVQETGQAVPVPTPDIVDLARQGKKIQAISRFLELNPDISIFQAKDVIDGLSTPKPVPTSQRVQYVGEPQAQRQDSENYDPVADVPPGG